MKASFFDNTTLIKYSNELFQRVTFASVDEITLIEQDQTIKWLNTYGLDYVKEFKTIITKDELDDFLLKLVSNSEHPNKVIVLDNLLFIAIKVLKTDSATIDYEQMMFIVSPDFVWSIQEQPGDYFQWIRERLELNTGIVRRKKADYLLFLILESIIDNYQTTYEENSELAENHLDPSAIKPTPDFTAKVEKRKNELFTLKKASISLRDTLTKLEKTEVKGIKPKYFSELKEEVINLIADIDFELQALESKLNLVFSIQGHRLNEVMKTLTVFSVIFIPLTFVAGLYGMNFKNMPELETEYGYYIVLFVMLLIIIISVIYIKKKRWF